MAVQEFQCVPYPYSSFLNDCVTKELYPPKITNFLNLHFRWMIPSEVMTLLTGNYSKKTFESAGFHQVIVALTSKVLYLEENNGSRWASREIMLSDFRDFCTNELSPMLKEVNAANFAEYKKKGTGNLLVRLQSKTGYDCRAHIFITNFATFCCYASAFEKVAVLEEAIKIGKSLFMNQTKPISNSDKSFTMMHSETVAKPTKPEYSRSAAFLRVCAAYYDLRFGRGISGRSWYWTVPDNMMIPYDLYEKIDSPFTFQEHYQVGCFMVSRPNISEINSRLQLRNVLSEMEVLFRIPMAVAFASGKHPRLGDKGIPYLPSWVELLEDDTIFYIFKLAGYFGPLKHHYFNF